MCIVVTDDLAELPICRDRNGRFWLPDQLKYQPVTTHSIVAPPNIDPVTPGHGAPGDNSLPDCLIPLYRIVCLFVRTVTKWRANTMYIQ